MPRRHTQSAALASDIQDRFQEEKSRCKSKVRYITEAAAEDAAYIARMQFGTYSRPYQCVWCEGFHLTTGDAP